MAAICNRASTRYQRYSCVHGFGHAFMRVYAEQLAPALHLCRALGKAEGSDCAQGAFHDYWFSVNGLDSTKAATPAPVTDPARALRRAGTRLRQAVLVPRVRRQPAGRLPDRIGRGRRPPLHGLAGLQRDACITAASVIGPPDPAAQLEVCAEFRGPDAVSCIHGTKVQNLLGSSTATYLGVIRNCAVFRASARRACYFWLGKTLSVVTDGRFRRDGCPALSPAGARSMRGRREGMNGPLVTFS